MPGGGVDKGEPPEAAALRELAEETGYLAETAEPLGSMYVSPGATTEVCHMFAVRCGGIAEPRKEALEVISTKLFTRGEFERMIHDGTFRYGMGISAWMKYRLKEEMET